MRKDLARSPVSWTALKEHIPSLLIIQNRSPFTIKPHCSGNRQESEVQMEDEVVLDFLETPRAPAPLPGRTRTGRGTPES